MDTFSVKTDGFELRSQDGLWIKGRHWIPINAKAIVCLIHGLGDHMMRYVHVAQYLAAEQIAVIAYDQRGHGISEGKRGHTASYEALLDDVEAVLKKAKELYPMIPLFLYGHSMGGNVAANYVLRRNTNDLKGVILSSPWFRLGFNPPAIKVFLGKLMSNIYAAFTEPNQIDATQLSNDPAVAAAYNTDSLVHHVISTGMFVAMHKGGEYIMDHARNLTIPAILMHGGDDRITSVAATREFAQKAGEKVVLKIWDGLRHETHNEFKKAEVMAYVKEWIDEQLTQN